MNVTDLEEAVYTINKAAKRLKYIRYKTGYTKSKCSVEKLLKKQEYLYDLKNQIINKALLEGVANEEGIHRVKKSNGDEISYVYVRFTNRSFHIPVGSIECKITNDLGNLSYRTYVPFKGSNGFNTGKAKNILNSYLFNSKYN